MPSEVRVIVHEVVRVYFDTESIFIFEEQVVIKPFCPIPLKQPVFIMALPSDVEAGVVAYDHVSWQIRHVILLKQESFQII